MFITFEGIEGSGKTTQVRSIAQFLREKGYDCIVTREPGGTHVGKKIRSVLLDPENKGIDPMTEVLLYTADRNQHLKEVVLPSLSAGKIVLCDRYFDATVVYQGIARGVGIRVIQTIHRLFLNDFKPDMTILLDLPPDLGLSRAWRQIEKGDRAEHETRFEQEALAFHRKVREGYLELARLEPSRFHIFDASRDIEEISRELIDLLSSAIA